MNDKLQQLLILVSAASFSLAMSGCDLADKNIGETSDSGCHGGDGDGDGDGDVGECTPPDPSVSFSFEPLDFGLGEFENASINTTCTVLAADVVDGIYLELDCPETQDPVIVDVTATPTLSIPVLVGESVRVRYRRLVTTWVDTYLELESESGQYLFSLVDAANLFPPDQDVIPFGLGTGIGTTYTGCSVGSNQCGDLERVLVRFDNDGAIEGVVDGSYLEIEPYPTINVWLVAARQVEQPQACAGTPTGWYRMLIATGSTP
jgi:hypothetical protein